MEVILIRTENNSLNNQVETFLAECNDSGDYSEMHSIFKAIAEYNLQEFSIKIIYNGKEQIHTYRP